MILLILSFLNTKATELHHGCMKVSATPDCFYIFSLSA